MSDYMIYTPRFIFIFLPFICRCIRLGSDYFYSPAEHPIFAIKLINT